MLLKSNRVLIKFMLFNLEIIKVFILTKEKMHIKGIRKVFLDSVFVVEKMDTLL